MKNLLQKNICKILFSLLALIQLLAFRATPLNVCKHSVIAFQIRRGKIPNCVISAVVSALVCNALVVALEAVSEDHLLRRAVKL